MPTGCCQTQTPVTYSLTLYLAHEQVNVCIHIQLLQLLKVPCQLQEKSPKGDVYLDPHLHRMVRAQYCQGPRIDL